MLLVARILGAAFNSQVLVDHLQEIGKEAESDWDDGESNAISVYYLSISIYYHYISNIQ